MQREKHMEHIAKKSRLFGMRLSLEREDRMALGRTARTLCVRAFVCVVEQERFAKRARFPTNTSRNSDKGMLHTAKARFEGFFRVASCQTRIRIWWRKVLRIHFSQANAFSFLRLAFSLSPSRANVRIAEHRFQVSEKTQRDGSVSMCHRVARFGNPLFVLTLNCSRV